MLDGLDVTTAAIGLALGLAAVGLTIAWLPAVRVEGFTVLLPRLLFLAGIAAILADGAFGLGTVLGLALLLLGGVAGWQARPDPELPRPRRVGILLTAVLSGLVVVAADRGWWLLGGVPDVAVPWTALALGLVGALATLAIADRERVRFREALLRSVPPT